MLKWTDSNFGQAVGLGLFALGLTVGTGYEKIKQLADNKECEVRIDLGLNKMESHWAVRPCKEV